MAQAAVTSARLAAEYLNVIAGGAYVAYRDATNQDMIAAGLAYYQAKEAQIAAWDQVDILRCAAHELEYKQIAKRAGLA